MDLTREVLLARARELVEPLRARAGQAEELRYVPQENVDAIVDAHLMRIATPRKFGGLDVSYETMLEAGVILASGCGSTGWCYALWAVDSWIARLVSARSPGGDLCDWPRRADLRHVQPDGRPLDAGAGRLPVEWSLGVRERRLLVHVDLPGLPGAGRRPDVGGTSAR